MRKAFITLIICICTVCLLASCATTTQLDFDDEVAFETTLNAGGDMIGKTVSFTVKDIKPNSAFGYDLWAGEHLNFVSSADPNAHIGDTLAVRITGVRNVMGSWIITYDLLKRN